MAPATRSPTEPMQSPVGFSGKWGPIVPPGHAEKTSLLRYIAVPLIWAQGCPKNDSDEEHSKSQHLQRCHPIDERGWNKLVSEDPRADRFTEKSNEPECCSELPYVRCLLSCLRLAAERRKPECQAGDHQEACDTDVGHGIQAV